MGTIRGLFTLALMAAFVGLVIWLFVFRSRRDFDDAANIPLEQDGDGEHDE